MTRTSSMLWGTTGATLYATVFDADAGTTLVARTGTGITESPVASGRYLYSFTTDAAVRVSVLWDDGTDYAEDVIDPFAPAINVPTEAEIAAELLATTNGAATVGAQLQHLDLNVSSLIGSSAAPAAAKYLGSINIGDEITNAFVRTSGGLDLSSGYTVQVVRNGNTVVVADLTVTATAAAIVYTYTPEAAAGWTLGQSLAFRLIRDSDNVLLRQHDYELDVTASNIATAVWDAARADHTTAGTFGEGVASVAGSTTSVTNDVPVDEQAIADTVAATLPDPRGPGADQVTLVISTPAGLPVADAAAWITSSNSINAVVADKQQTDSNGRVTFLLDDGATYWLWAQKDGYISIQGRQFTAVAD